VRKGGEGDIMDEDDILTYKDEEDIINECKKITAEQVQQIPWEDLKKQAEIFCEAYKNYINKHNEANSTVSKLKNQIPKELRSLYEEIRAKRILFQAGKEVKDLFLALSNFDKALTSYLGELPKKFIYVYEGKDGKIETFVGDMSLMYKSIKIIDGKAKIQPSIRTLRKEADLIDKNMTYLSSKGFRTYEKMDAMADVSLDAFKGTQARLNVFYAKYNYSQKQGGLLMWKIGETKWAVATVQNAGDLKEAYAASLIHPEFISQYIGHTGTPPYYSHSLIGNFFTNYITKVTNAGAVGGEDVTGQVYQYAVKSANAEAPNLFQFYTQALLIANSQGELSREQIKENIEIFEQKEGIRNRVLAEIEKDSQLELDEILNSGFTRQFMTWKTNKKGESVRTVNRKRFG
jgi:hypothetical protein